MNRSVFAAVLSFAVLLVCLSCGSAGQSPPQADASGSVETVSSGVPVLVDLGSTTCMPCRLMADELEMLDSLTGPLLEVRVIDVNQDPEAASEFGVRIIPLQVFISENGEELFRHEGFISCEDMLSRWETLGYQLRTGD